MKLQQILEKERNISNIRRLTSAIQTISMVKRQQSKKMRDKMLLPLSMLKNEIKKMHYEAEYEKSLHIVFTVDKKLCKNFIHLASSYIANLQYDKNDSFLFCGKYAIENIKNVDNEKLNISVITSIEDSSCVADIAMTYLVNQHQITIHFYSCQDEKFIKKTLLHGMPKNGDNASLIKLYIAYSINMAAIETSMMENASRAVAMSQASDTCKSMQHQLKLDYNRLRQERITLEMSEIIGGANA